MHSSRDVTRGMPGRRLVSLGQVKAPKPLNLPSQKQENHGLDPSVNIVPKTGGCVWQTSDAPPTSGSAAGTNPWNMSKANEGLPPTSAGGGGTPLPAPNGPHGSGAVGPNAERSSMCTIIGSEGGSRRPPALPERDFPELGKEPAAPQAVPHAGAHRGPYHHVQQWHDDMLMRGSSEQIPAELVHSAPDNGPPLHEHGPSLAIAPFGRPDPRFASDDWRAGEGISHRSDWQSVAPSCMTQPPIGMPGRGPFDRREDALPPHSKYPAPRSSKPSFGYPMDGSGVSLMRGHHEPPCIRSGWEHHERRSAGPVGDERWLPEDGRPVLRGPREGGMHRSPPTPTQHPRGGLASMAGMPPSGKPPPPPPPPGPPPPGQPMLTSDGQLVPESEMAGHVPPIALPPPVPPAAVASATITPPPMAAGRVHGESLADGMATNHAAYPRDCAPEAVAVQEGGVVWRGTGPDRFTSANLPEHLRILQRAPGETKRLWEPKRGGRVAVVDPTGSTSYGPAVATTAKEEEAVVEPPVRLQQRQRNSQHDAVAKHEMAVADLTCVQVVQAPPGLQRAPAAVAPPHDPNKLLSRAATMQARSQARAAMLMPALLAKLDQARPMLGVALGLGRARGATGNGRVLRRANGKRGAESGDSQQDGGVVA